MALHGKGSRSATRRMLFGMPSARECRAIRDRAALVEPLFDTPYGTRKFTVRDPDGNQLGFVREDEIAAVRDGRGL